MYTPWWASVAVTRARRFHGKALQLSGRSLPVEQIEPIGIGGDRRAQLRMLIGRGTGLCRELGECGFGLRIGVGHTPTSDNGKDFADHPFIACALGSDFFFADPYSAWQRGSNENANGLTRQYLPRSMNFSTITGNDLRGVERCLYNCPRKRLGFTTPLEVFSEESINTVANQT